MPKLNELILAALKRAGVEIDADARDRAKSELEGLEFPVDEIVGPDQKVVDREEYGRTHRDLQKWKREARDVRGELDELRDAVDQGDSDNARKASEYKKKLEKFEPLISEFLEKVKSDWASVEGKIPEEIKSFFRFPEEGKDLDEDALIHNHKKLEEYRTAGILDKLTDEPAPDDDSSPDLRRGSPTDKKSKVGDKDPGADHPDVAMAKAYNYQPNIDGG